MTKVTLEYDLMRPLDDAAAEAVARAHSVYGIARVRVVPALNRISVDFDASRLFEKDVENSLINAGVPIRRRSVPS